MLKQAHQRLFALIFIFGLVAVLVYPLATRSSRAATATLDGIGGVSEGAALRGPVTIQALTTGQVSRVIFRLSGPVSPRPSTARRPTTSPATWAACPRAGTLPRSPTGPIRSA